MERREISLDDVEDVIEISLKMELKLKKLIEENQLDISLISLINSSVKIIVDKCESKDEVEKYLECINFLFDIKIKEVFQLAG